MLHLLDSTSVNDTRQTYFSAVINSQDRIDAKEYICKGLMVMVITNIYIYKKTMSS